MKAIFLVKDKAKVRKVYSEELINRLDFSEPLIEYTKEEIVTNPRKFATVKYIFSTWYMPDFNENEIKEYFPVLEAVFYAAGTVKYFAEPFMKCGVKVFSSASTANCVCLAAEQYKGANAQDQVRTALINDRIYILKIISGVPIDAYQGFVQYLDTNKGDAD